MLRQAGEQQSFTITCRSDPSRVARCSGPANSRYAQNRCRFNLDLGAMSINVMTSLRFTEFGLPSVLRIEEVPAI